MEDKKINNKLVEQEYEVKENAPILDCTNEIEEYMKDVIPQ